MGAPALPGNWDGLVVVCGTTPWHGNRFCDQHIAEQLTRFAPVLYVDPPVSPVEARRDPAAARRWRELGLVLERPGLARLTPPAPPGKERPGIKPVTVSLTRAAMARATRRLGARRVAAVIVPSLNRLFGACGEQRRVFYAKDDYVAGAELMATVPRRLRRRERLQPAAADLVVAVSPVLAERYRRSGHEVLFLPSGCDAPRFAATDDTPLPADVGHAGAVAGFVGHLSDRVDVALLEAIADRDADRGADRGAGRGADGGYELLLVGDRQASCDANRFASLLARPNVRWVGPRPFAALPGYLRAVRVGLVPYTDSAFNRASFPLKTLEYLAAGRAVVATDLPAIRWLDSEHVRVARRAAEFVDAVDAAVRVPLSPALVAARRAFAARHSWSARGERLAAAMGLTPGAAVRPLASVGGEIG
ncbi:MAG TPA: glycosyltransferase [Mycobacteriales bacterium]|nr:glycosyltransferase [Mycobacteriales bacterium]